MVLSFYFAVSRTFSPKELSSINGKQITSYDRLLMFVLCICDFTAVCTQQLAFQKDSSSFISIISYMSIVYGFAADFFIFDIAVKFIQIIASCMIIVVNLFLTVSKFRTKQWMSSTYLKIVRIFIVGKLIFNKIIRLYVGVYRPSEFVCWLLFIRALSFSCLFDDRNFKVYHPHIFLIILTITEWATTFRFFRNHARRVREQINWISIFLHFVSDLFWEFL